MSRKRGCECGRRFYQAGGTVSPLEPKPGSGYSLERFHKRACVVTASRKTLSRLESGDGCRLDEADVVFLGAGGGIRHCRGEKGRAVIVGRLTPRMKEVYDALWHCHESIEPSIRDQASSNSVVDVAHHAVKGRLGQAFVPHFYSLRKNCRETKRWGHQDGEFLIERGMVVRFETLYFEAGRGLIQLENTYLVGEDEAKRIEPLAKPNFVCATN